jgi:hypothetical protein
LLDSFGASCIRAPRLVYVREHPFTEYVPRFRESERHVSVHALHVGVIGCSRDSNIELGPQAALLTLGFGEALTQLVICSSALCPGNHAAARLDT